MKKKYDYLIVGAGLYGSVCAYELSKNGFKCLVVDKRNHLGGNVYTKEIEGINVHVYGPHIFHTSEKRIWDYMNRFARFNDFINSPIAIYKGEKYPLPFNMNTFVKIWKDVKTPEEAKRKIEEEKQRYHIEEPKNLEEQAINLVGKTIYERLIKGYTAKQWGRPCNELPSFIIKRIPVRFTYDNNYFNDIYQGIPIGGYTPIIEKMLEGVNVRLNTDYFSKKEELDLMADDIIYTGPIDQYFAYRYGQLEYRSLRFEMEILDKEDYQGNAVMNYTEYGIPYTRIIEHRHFEFNHSSPRTIVSKEYPVVWKKGDEPYYPINDEKNNALYLEYKKEAENLGHVHFGGRLGQYQYFDMDKVVSEALELTKTLIQLKRNPKI